MTRGDLRVLLQGQCNGGRCGCFGCCSAGHLVPFTCSIVAQLCWWVWRRPCIHSAPARCFVPALPPARQLGRFAGRCLVFNGKGLVCGKQAAAGERCLMHAAHMGARRSSRGRSQGALGVMQCSHVALTGGQLVLLPMPGVLAGLRSILCQLLSRLTLHVLAHLLPTTGLH